MRFATRVRHFLDRLRPGGARRRGEALAARGAHREAAEVYATAGLGERAALELERAAAVEVSALERLALWRRAAELGDEAARPTRSLRAHELEIDLHASGERELMPAELAELGRRLLAVGAPLLAASAFEFAGDDAAEVEALVASGDVERLDAELEERERDARLAASTQAEERALAEAIADGRRRVALAMAPRSAPARELQHRVRARLPRRGPLALDRGRGPELVLLGDRLRVGRGEVELVCGAPGLSREQLVIEARGGEAWLLDPGSRNGNFMGGARLPREMKLGGATELMLAGEVALRLAPNEEGGLSLEFGAEQFVAPLGPLVLPAGASLRSAGDGCVELWRGAEPLFLGELPLGRCSELLLGDRVRGRDGVLVVELLR